MKSDAPVIGGGFKKVLYTLNTVRRIGVKNAAKALSAHNACEACGLGMGGQRGGMVNELDEIPSVCNKSIQAQSTDIQGPIPEQIFKHTLAELRELSAQEMERLGRLGTPLHKAKDADRFTPVSWGDALHLIPVQRFDFSTFKQHHTIREVIAATIPGMQDLADIDVAKSVLPGSQRVSGASS